VGKEQLNTLVSIGAFRFTGKPKKRLLWEANFLQQKNRAGVHATASLFLEPPLEFTLPELTDHPLDDLYDEIEILGFTLSNPFTLVDDDPSLYVPARNLGSHLGKIVTVRSSPCWPISLPANMSLR
jgi:DNA polymerase-3 subunit alpha